MQDGYKVFKCFQLLSLKCLVGGQFNTQEVMQPRFQVSCVHLGPK